MTNETISETPTMELRWAWNGWKETERTEAHITLAPAKTLQQKFIIKVTSDTSTISDCPISEEVWRDVPTIEG